MNMFNQYEQSIYLRGARDILLRLKDDFELQMTPILDAVCNQNEMFKLDGFSGKSTFAMPYRKPKEQKMYGRAMLDLLIHDKRALENVLLQEVFEVQSYDIKKNKKGEITDYKLKLL